MTTVGPPTVRAGRRTERLLLGAAFVTFLGNSIHLTAAALLIVRTEQTAASVGLLMIVFAVPQALLSLVFGRIADRVDRRLLCVWCDVVSAVVAVGLPVAIALGVPSSTAAYVTTFLLSVVFAMYLPAVSAIVKERVPGPGLPRFNADFEIAVQSGTLLSTAIGGFAVQAFGVDPVFLFNAATFVASAALIFALGPRVETEVATAARSAHDPAPARRPVARIAVLYALGSGILTVTNTLVVVLVVQTFAQDAGVLGVVDSLAGVGVLVAAALYKRATRRVDQLTIALVGYLSCAVFIALYPRLGIVGLLFLYTIGSACFGLARVAARTMLLDAVTERTVGRVFGAANAAGLAFSVVATLVITQLTDRIDIGAGYLAFAAVVAVVALVGAGLLRGHRFAPPHPTWKDTS